MAGVQVSKILIGACFAALALGCGGQDEASVSGGDIEFPALGSLSTEAGQGSFRFGAASAATQIEDQNTATDWHLFTLPKAQGGLGQHTYVGDASKGWTKMLDDVALIKAEQCLFARGQVIARKGDFAVKYARLAHAAQSFLCIP